jgi:hypothetical protein
MKKPRIKLAFLITWITLTLIAQIPVIILGSVVRFERNSMFIIELLTIILTCMATALAIAKEEVVDGKEIIRKE